MTILALAQTCATRLQLTSPSAFIGSADNNMILLKAMFDQTIDELKEQFAWPELTKEYTFTLATSTASYALPSDFDRHHMDSLWNRTQHLPLNGPLDSIAWQNYKSGSLATFPNQRYRVKGWVTNQFFIDPTPTSVENGQTCAYEYVSKTARRPKTWVASTSWVLIQYCSYNGNIYDRGGVGAASTGTTAPTHTTGAVSDGSITWTYLGTEYAFTNDTDEVLLDNEIVKTGAVWRFKRERGLDYEDLRRDWQEMVDIAKTKLEGAPNVSIGICDQGTPMIDYDSIPEGSYGL